jgi:OmpA-OmpF porin, OOP family
MSERTLLGGPRVPVLWLLASTLVWFGGSTWWYVCKIQVLCNDKPVAAVVTPAVATPNVAPAVQKAKFSETVEVTFQPDDATFAGFFDVNATKAENMVQFLKANPTAKMNISGYVALAQGSAFSDDQLALARANALADHFKSRGVNAAQISVKSVGVSNLADNSTPEGQARNRRAVVEIVNN